MAYSEFSDDFEEESRAEPIKIIGERDPEAQAAVGNPIFCLVPTHLLICVLLNR